MGIGCGELRPAGVLRYRAEIADLVENELDHLLVTAVDETPRPDPDEVVEWRFVALDELARVDRGAARGLHRVVPARLGDRHGSSSAAPA